MAYREMARFGRVITTPSTTLTDALRLGVAPVLAVAAPLQSDLVYGAYPVQARDAQSVTQALRADPAAHLDVAWQAIRPGAPMTLDRLQAALRGLPA